MLKLLFKITPTCFGSYWPIFREYNLSFLTEVMDVLPEDGPVYDPKHVGVILNNNFNILCD
jgi:hypothetical protein